jgi:hypothetical protein
VVALREAYIDAGALSADSESTVPALLSNLRSSRRITSAPPAPERLKLWPFALALAVGFFAVVQLAPSTPSRVEGAELPSVPPLDDRALLGDAGSLLPALEERGQDAGAPDDSGEPDAADGGVAEPDAASTPDVTSLSSFEREERAKDALDRAQRALEAGDRAAAAAALDEAQRYDPEHPDIAELRRKL